MPATKTQLSAITSAFLAAFNSLSADAHITLRARSCTHFFAPVSLGTSAKSNNQFAIHIPSTLHPLLSSLPLPPKEIHTHPTTSGGQTMTWATGTPIFGPEVIDGERGEWDYTGEYIFVLDVDESGMIARVLEFLDSAGG